MGFRIAHRQLAQVDLAPLVALGDLFPVVVDNAPGAAPVTRQGHHDFLAGHEDVARMFEKRLGEARVEAARIMARYRTARRSTFGLQIADGD